ncbi:MAG: peptidoglycan-binding domain-containing protein [Alphaproteobacteria bacterium]
MLSQIRPFAKKYRFNLSRFDFIGELRFHRLGNALATIATMVTIPAAIVTVAMGIDYFGAGVDEAGITIQSDSSIEPSVGFDHLVATIQDGMTRNGLFDGIPDGYADAETKRAISSTQYLLGMPATGDASEELCIVLKYLAEERDMILPLQIVFFDRGQIKSSPDGTINAETRVAIKNAEREFGLRPDGIPDQHLFVRVIGSLADRPLRDATLAMLPRSLPYVPPIPIAQQDSLGLECSPVPILYSNSDDF